MMDKDLINPRIAEEKDEEEKQDSPNILEKILKTRNILLSGEINKTLAEKVIRQLILMEDQGEEPIRVFIDSPGGDADAGYALFDMLRKKLDFTFRDLSFANFSELKISPKDMGVTPAD